MKYIPYQSPEELQTILEGLSGEEVYQGIRWIELDEHGEPTRREVMVEDDPLQPALLAQSLAFFRGAAVRDAAEIPEADARHWRRGVVTWMPGAAYKAGDMVLWGSGGDTGDTGNTGGAGASTLYEIMQDITAQEHQPPDAQGMIAVYRPIPVKREGGAPEYVYGMSVKKDDIVTWQGKLYRWLQADGVALWEPGAAGTAALWELVG